MSLLCGDEPGAAHEQCKKSKRKRRVAGPPGGPPTLEPCRLGLGSLRRRSLPGRLIDIRDLSPASRHVCMPPCLCSGTISPRMLVTQTPQVNADVSSWPMPDGGARCSRVAVPASIVSTRTADEAGRVPVASRGLATTGCTAFRSQGRPARPHPRVRFLPSKVLRSSFLCVVGFTNTCRDSQTHVGAAAATGRLLPGRLKRYGHQGVSGPIPMRTCARPNAYVGPAFRVGSTRRRICCGRARARAPRQPRPAGRRASTRSST